MQLLLARGVFGLPFIINIKCTIIIIHEKALNQSLTPSTPRFNADC